MRAGGAPAAVPAALPRTIWYMGAKARVIPGLLDDAIERLLPRGGRLLDLMTGTGTVAAFAARRGPVTANDVQLYSHAIARSLIERPPGDGEVFARGLDFDRDLLPAFEENRSGLEALYRPALEREAELLEGSLTGNGSAAACLVRYRRFLDGAALYGSRGPGAGPFRRASRLTSEPAIAEYRRDPRRSPACLLTAYHSNVFFGLRQAVDLDSLRAAIDRLPADGRSERKRVHYLSALLHTASVATSGTAHFAQPRQPGKDSDLLAMARRRRRDIVETFRGYSEEIASWVAAVDLRSENRTLRRDYRELIEEGPRGPAFAGEARAEVVYLDPPYTADNYSRFYHVLETLAAYDYPPLARGADGLPLAGRYPEIERRFQSGFCRPSRVEGEFRRVIGAAAGSGASLIVSYGSPGGLLLKVYRGARRESDPVEAMRRLCLERYLSVDVRRRSLTHSGMGDKNAATDELLFLCERPR